MYVQIPSKENKYDNQLPYGTDDYNNINADNLLEKLEDSGVNTYDLREEMKNDKLDYYSSFFKTDHHWLPQTGVWAAGKIAGKINTVFGTNIDTEIGNLNNYNVKVYKDFCLGSQGKKVTLKYTNPEDISLITPKKQTSFTVSYLAKSKTYNGDFTETMIDKSVFEKIDYYNTSTYSAYLKGNLSLVNIKNNNVKNGLTICVFADSFDDSMVPYLAMGVENINVIDARSFNGSVRTYIEKTNPDYVIMAYNPTTINSDGSAGFSLQ